MMVLLLTILALPILRQEQPAAPMQSGGAAGGVPAATTDISNMSPIEAANRLYNRVMQAASNNDSAQVQMFLPMAIDAHEMAKPLSADAAFHLSSLQRMGLRNDEALTSAQEALESDPNHLLLLYTGGEAAKALGRDDVAREYAARMLQFWDEEMSSGKQEYDLHSGMMEDVRNFAEANAGDS
jgi:tetratricopeptide (TPR) repeat protein